MAAASSKSANLAPGWALNLNVYPKPSEL